MTKPNTTSIEVDMTDETFMALAKEAHARDITLNELCCEILQAYVDDKIDLEEEQIRERHENRIAARTEQQTLNEIEDALRDATKHVVIDGVTTETMNAFGRAFSRWDYEFHGDKTSTEIIQDGFDDASMEEPPF
jgi:hypothetical protein